MIGPIHPADAQWLLEHLEHGGGPATVVWLDRPTLDMLLERGASAELLENLAASLEGQEGAEVEVLLDQRNSLPYGTTTVDDASPSLDQLDEQSPAADVYIGSVRLACAVCKHTRFRHRKAQLQTALASFFNVEWTAPSADCYICTQCGFVHWFMPS
ncbi:MAG: hypothetical protein K2R93_01990 [Gemmatimonadaceae bacterium]|nr:hypothetical protein [Gemmatimonadaceae bacterium]